MISGTLGAAPCRLLHTDARLPGGVLAGTALFSLPQPTSRNPCIAVVTETSHACSCTHTQPTRSLTRSLQSLRFCASFHTSVVADHPPFSALLTFSLALEPYPLLTPPYPALTLSSVLIPGSFSAATAWPVGQTLCVLIPSPSPLFLLSFLRIFPREINNHQVRFGLL